jgi:hypothetical protein
MSAWGSSTSMLRRICSSAEGDTMAINELLVEACSSELVFSLRAAQA